jgi:hypothetical protein
VCSRAGQGVPGFSNHRLVAVGSSSLSAGPVAPAAEQRDYKREVYLLTLKIK